MDDGSENPEIVSKFEKLDFLSLWKGREKVNQVEKQILSLFHDLLSQLSQGASHFKGCWRNLHGLEFPSARRYSVLHAKPSDFTDAGTHEAICYPTSFTSICQRTVLYVGRTNKIFARFHPPILRNGNSHSQMLISL